MLPGSDQAAAAARQSESSAPVRTLHRSTIVARRPSAADVDADSSWRPNADVYRFRGRWVIKLDLAGVLPEDISIDREGARLLIRGKRRDMLRLEGGSLHLMEIAYSSFERAIELPLDLERTRVASYWQHGMLVIELEEEEEAEEESHE